jgi:hypothetical protein
MVLLDEVPLNASAIETQAEDVPPKLNPTLSPLCVVVTDS